MAQILLVLLVFLFLRDILRMQAILYYACVLLAIATSEWLPRWSKEQALRAIQFTTLLLYFWGGIQKFNLAYSGWLFPWLLSPMLKISSPEPAVLSAISEIALVPLILFRPTRRFGVVLALTMHLVILGVMGPLGLNWDPHAWLWSVTQMLLVVILFWKDPKKSIEYFWPFSPAMLFCTALIHLFPFLNLFGLCNNYLAFTPYTGSVVMGTLMVDQKFIQETKLPLDKYWNPENGELLWPVLSLQDNGNTLFPTEFYLKAAFREICLRHHDHEHGHTLQLRIQQPPRAFFGAYPPEKKLDCAVLD